MLDKLRLVFAILLCTFILSCSQKHETKRLLSHTSFQWNEKVDSLLDDSTKSSPAILALKKKILLTTSDTQAINKLAILGDSITDEAVYAIGDELIKHSKAINYPLGIIYGLEQKGIQFVEDSRYDSANACFEKGFAIATKIGNEKMRGKLIYRFGVVNYFESQYEKALDNFNKALTIGDSLNDAKLSADCLYKIGETDRYMYNYFDALGYFNRAIQAAYEISDTERVRECLQSVGDVYRLQAVYPTALYYYNQCLNMAKPAGEQQRVDECLYNIGEVYQQQADNIKAMDYFNQSIDIAKEINDQSGIAACLASLATIYTLEADFVKALEYHNEAIKIEKEQGDDGDLAYSYVGMGDIYRQEKDFANALSSYKMGMSIAQKTVDKTLYNTSLNLIGEVYREEGNATEALNYYNQAITLAQKIQDDDNLSSAYYNMGRVYSVLQDDKEALEYYQKSLDIARANKANHMIAECLYGLGEIYVKSGDVQKAKDYATESLKAAQLSNEPAGIQNAAKLLSQADKQLGDFKTALLMNELFVKMKDSISNVEEIKKFSTVEYKSKEDQLKSEEEKTTAVLKAEAGKNEAELKRQKTIRYAFTVGFLLVLLFSGLIYRGLQKSKKQTLIIGQQKTEVELQRTFAEQQKALVDEKNKEIIDSITYAKRLQDAILPPVGLIEQHLPDSFILYKPKAIVAGDFYWMEKIGDEILLAAADCTGHGVPGAMVSVVCSNALNSAVKEFDLIEPGEILDKVRELVVETFDRSGSDVKDGMDISLCSLNTKTREMKWSGANNPLWYLQNNELKEIRPDKQPIGIYDKVKPFTTHNIKLNQGDTVYLFSDGYADQFGGDKGKKFKYRQIQTKILEFATSSLKEQGNILHNTFEEWKGMLEQVDDVLMIGIRV
jgi:tetratricopeptide (TPR) repeat protein